MSGNLDTPIRNLTSVGKTTALRLKKLGLETVADLLYFFPTRHDDFTEKKPIGKLNSGDKANIVGTIDLIKNRRAKRRRMNITEALISDQTGSLKVIWFNQPYLTKNLSVGDKVSLAGSAEDSYGVLTMASPIYEKINKKDAYHTAGLVPVYRLTEGVTQKQIRFLVKQSLEFVPETPEPLPEDMLRRLEMPFIKKAIKDIHFPKNKKDLENARKRLAFDELLRLQLISGSIKRERKNAKARKVEFKKDETRRFVEDLPFELTDDQKKAAWQAIQDMAEERPMSRLLNGDVGSGKTAVAAIVMLNTALNKGFQSALMAPTEILARQHYKTITGILGKFGLNIALLTGSQNALNADEDISKAKLRKMTADGQIDIMIGTHCLVSEKLKFKDLALAVIDEQHRFGVEQRRTLMGKSSGKEAVPHLLSMTATPIPRSLALALFGDLDISLISQMPKGRKPIVTKVVGDERRGKVYEFIKKQIKEGRQAFVICPLIEESDRFGVKSAEVEYKTLKEGVFSDIPINMLHGKMKAREKETAMKDFLNGKSKILVSTSVVEVGVDVPEASIMMVEGAERFGLAQLHQFRGRIGRGAHRSYCILFADSKTDASAQRLKALESTSDGFKLAEMDLKLRGGGEIYGTRQKGFPEMKIATLWDYDLMKKAKEEALRLLENDPELDKLPDLKKIIIPPAKEAHLE